MAKKKKPAEKTTYTPFYKRKGGEPPFNYEKELETKGKAVGYFATVQGRYGGARRQVTKVYKAWENGMFTIVNVTYKKVSIAQGITAPFQLRTATKKDFDSALKKVLSQILI